MAEFTINKAEFTIKKDGRKVGTIKADDGRIAGARAIMRWGPGNYDVSMVRGDGRCTSCGTTLLDSEYDSCFDCEDFGDQTP